MLCPNIALSPSSLQIKIFSPVKVHADHLGDCPAPAPNSILSDSPADWMERSSNGDEADQRESVIERRSMEETPCFSDCSSEEEEESEAGEEKLKNNLGDDLEVNFEIASIEDLAEIEKNESANATKEAEDEPLDMGEMLNMAENVEEANEPTEEEFEVSSSAEEEVAIHGSIESMEDDNDQPSEDESDAGIGDEDIEELGQDFEEEGDESSNAVGGTALFDSIDLMRQAVEFLTVTK